MDSDIADWRPLLRREVYDVLGRRYQELFHRSRRDIRGVANEALALKVLDILDPDVRTRERLGYATDLRRWIDRNEGELPRQSRRAWRSKEEREMEEQLRWVGLAVVVALACGVLIYANRNRSATPQERGPNPMPPPLPQDRPIIQVLRFAVVLPASKVRDIGTADSEAGELLTRATYWWCGKPSTYDGLLRDIGAQPAPETPAEDEFLLVTFDVVDFTGSLPTSRPEGSIVLRQATQRGRTRYIENMSVGRLDGLEDAGFHR